MRLKIEFYNDSLELPLNYQPILQGFIYHIFNEKEYGQFLHDEGYREGKRVYKHFVFSNLFGEYEVNQDRITYHGKIKLYISAYSEEFMKIVYEFLSKNTLVNLNNHIVKVNHLEFQDLNYFGGIKTLKIKTLSPIVAYRTENNYFHYFRPSDCEFETICVQNLEAKNNSLNKPIKQVIFSINKVLFEKKRLLRFKNTFYVSYLTELEVSVNYDTLCLIYDTGLSSKGSAGFGMVEIVR